MPEYTLPKFGPGQSRDTLPTNTDPQTTERTNFRTSVINLDRPGDPSVFSTQTRADAAELISRYPAGQARSALLPLLHLVQAEQGYVSPDGIAFCADTLDLTKAQVAAVATFYTMYKRQPTGEYLVSICTNTLCGMMGGDEIYAAISDELGVGMNETTADGSITLEHAECLAACDYAPVVTVNYEFFDNQSVESTRQLVAQLRAGERPLPTRGAPLCSFKQIERQIAGIHDESTLALDATATGPESEAGVQLAIKRGETAPSYSIERTPEAAQHPAGTDMDTAHREEPIDDVGEFPMQTRASEASAGAQRAPAAKKSPARRSRTRRPATKSAEAAPASAGEGPSSSDAGVPTAESDPAHPSDPGTAKED